MKFFTSDNHFGHENVITKMGRNQFSSIEEHDAYLIDRINSVVGPQDQLYLLGDFAWTRPGRYRPKIKCRHIEFIIGNHDKPLLSKKCFGLCHHIRCTKFSTGDKVVLCHYPMAYWPASHHGAYHLYGHMHDKREYTLTQLFPKRRSMDVGVDSAFRLLGDYIPFSEDQILDLMYTRPGHDIIQTFRSDNATI